MNIEVITILAGILAAIINVALVKRVRRAMMSKMKAHEEAFDAVLVTVKRASGSEIVHEKPVSGPDGQQVLDLLGVRPSGFSTAAAHKVHSGV